jgi:predicted Zn-dependent protease
VSLFIPLVHGAVSSAASPDRLPRLKATRPVPLISSPADSEKQPFTFSPEDIELLEQSEQFERQLEKNGSIYDDEELDKYLDQVGQAVIPPGGPPDRVRWRFRVIRDPYINAFSLPNGSIYLNTGLLAQLENESQLAGVMAHECAHVIKRHAFSENKKLRKKARDKYILDMVSTWAPVFGTTGTAVSLLADTVRTVLVATVFGYSRELEREADVYAADRLIELNYDAEELLRTFRLLETSYEAEYVKLYYRDHPNLQERIAYTGLRLKGDTHKPVSSEQRAVYRLRYLSKTERVLRHDIQLNIYSGRFRTAFALSQKLVDFKPESSENVLHLAEAYRALGPRVIELRGEELTPKALKKGRKSTQEEEERALMSTSEGQSAARTNRANAEELYRKALAMDPKNARAHRGLGFLMEQAQRYQEALEHFREYLRLEPGAIDRSRIQRRIEALELIK